MDTSFDIIIIGGGMSGLSLFRKFIEYQITETNTVLIIEGREEYSKDKIWSFWNINQEDYSKELLKVWNQFEVINQTKKVTVKSEYPYLAIDSGRFYKIHLQMINSEPNASIIINSKVENTVIMDDKVKVVTGDGRTYLASQVFDSRPPQLELGPYDLLQHFKGIQIQTVNPVWTPEVVTLMDFRTDQSTGLNFIYVLPLSDHEAIVEATWFSDTIVDEEIYDIHLQKYLESRGIEIYEQDYEEIGVVPMSLSIPLQRSWKKIVKLGTAAGISRPSTGYTFLTSQWHADMIAKQLATGNKKMKGMRSRWKSFMDEILLRVLSKDHQRGPSTFVELFERNPHQRVIRFLSGTSSFIEDLKIMMRIPYKWTFVKAGIRGFFNRLVFWRS